jgi:carnitine O-acetyltransferase
MAADSVVTKPWPTKMVESHGDYREEAWLEDLDHNKTTIYQNQSSLPKLPVPSVEETLQRFLPTALPLAESKTEQRALEQAVARFPAQAQQLQERLLEKASDLSNQKSSWLQHWWNTLGYLQVRDSVVINVSYYFHFADDTTVGAASTSGSNSSTSTAQIQRAAAILYAAGQYRNQVASGALAPETLGRKNIPLCMTAYKYMFHACRIPHLQQDSYRIYDPSVYKHAVVACRGRFFKIPLIDETTGQVLSVSTLETHLETIMELASSEKDGFGHGFGYLTGDNRDVWATARTALLELPGMEDALEVLESGCVLVNLDTVSDLDAGRIPVSRAQCGKQFLYGNGNASNRWFDKSVQLIVCPNGKAGLLGEHSMMDGMPVVGLANHIVNTSYKQAREESESSSSVETYGGVSDIFDGVSVSLTPEIEKMIETSKHNFEEWTKGKHELDVQSFRGYGADFMKKAGFSPDAYAQMAMQVATSRLFGKQAGTYEATQTRVFEHGRTETTRTVSPASAAFVKSLMEPSNLTADDKIALLKGACQTHAKYIGNAAKGLGVDRHFLGLSLLVNDGEVMPDLYSDPVFVRSKRWKVSTSNLTHPKLENWGYGEVVPDGVGLSYSVHKNHLVFGITALKEHEGWPERLSQYLEDTLVEMKLLVEGSAANNSKDDASPPTRSKL